MIFHRFAAILPVAFLSTLLFPASAGANDLVVGQVADQSGFYGDATRDYIAGARTWFDYVNSQGGVRGQKIVLRLHDDGGVPEKTAELTKKVLDDDKADVLFGFVGDANVRAAVRSEAFQRSGVALVGSVSGLDPGPGGRNVFFTRASYESEVRRILEQFAGMGLRRVGLAVAPTESNRAVAAKAGELVRAAGLELVATREFPVTGQEPTEAAKDLFGRDPHVVIVLADSLGTASFVKAYRQFGTGAFVVALSIVNHVTVMELIGAKFATGTLISQVVPDPRKSNHALIGEHLALMKKYRDEPPSHLTLEGFLAAKALVAALQRARPGASRAEIATALRSLQRADIGGILIDFSGERRGYEFVDIAFLRKNGSLLR